MIDELDRILSIVAAALIAIGYGAFAVAEIRNSLRVERQCRQLAEEAKQLAEEARELGNEVDE